MALLIAVQFEIPDATANSATSSKATRRYLNRFLFIKLHSGQLEGATRPPGSNDGDLQFDWIKYGASRWYWRDKHDQAT
jgi:hypothetical protein